MTRDDGDGASQYSVERLMVSTAREQQLYAADRQCAFGALIGRRQTLTLILVVDLYLDKKARYYKISAFVRPQPFTGEIMNS